MQHRPLTIPSRLWHYTFYNMKRIAQHVIEKGAEVQFHWQTCLTRVCTPRIIRKALIAAVVVGSLLVGLNQGDLILSGQLTPQVVLKSLLTPVIPFCVTLLGAFLNSTTTARPEELRPGWHVIRRSLLIAVVVGSAIIALNQGDIILSRYSDGSGKILMAPLRTLLRPLYGAYIAYRSTMGPTALAAGWQQPQHLLKSKGRWAFVRMFRSVFLQLLEFLAQQCTTLFFIGHGLLET